MSEECIGYNDITKQFIYRDEETEFSLNASFDMKPEETKVNIWGYELCNGAEWKDFLDVVNKLGKDKADLEAKLAESEKKIKVIDEDRQFKAEMWTKFADKCKDLKQQLTEKEKEIAELKQRLKDTIKIYSDDFVEKDKELKELRFQARNIFPFVENLEEKITQDKISFCIEKLKSIKNELSNLIALRTNETFFIDGKKFKDYINNEIELIKKENKNV